MSVTAAPLWKGVDIRLLEPHDHRAIPAMLGRRGTNMSRVAREAGLYESACRNALISRGYPEAEEAIARAVGYPVEVLWPERYPTVPSHNPVKAAKSRQKASSQADTARARA